MRKLVLIAIFGLILMSCDSDFRQGNCDEGFFEQTDGNGGSFCVPITEEGVIDANEWETNRMRN